MEQELIIQSINSEIASLRQLREKIRRNANPAAVKPLELQSIVDLFLGIAVSTNDTYKMISSHYGFK